MIAFDIRTFGVDIENALAKIDRKEFAAKAGVSVAALYRFRNGEGMPNLRNFINIINALGRSPQRYLKKS